MPPETPRRLAIVAQDGPALVEAAAEGVSAKLGELIAPDQLEGARRDLATLAAALRRAMRDEEPDAVAESITGTGPVTFLLDQMGRELIRASWDFGATEALLEALRAWSDLRDVLAPPRVTSGRGTLREQLDGPNAFDLLVEVAHDFRSPLTSILFLAETLRDGHSGEISDLQRSQLGLIYSAAFGLASVASDVLELARRSQDLVEDEPEPYALAEVFANVERMVRPIVQEKGLELRMVVPAGQAAGHPHALTRVLLNLTTNALKFTDRGSVELGVRRLPHSRLQFYVQDTGRGIPEERQKDLFQPFKRRLGKSQEGHFFSGSGVGLSIARRLVQAMGSELQFETSDETGTTFFFDLPVAPRR